MSLSLDDIDNTFVYYQRLYLMTLDTFNMLMLQNFNKQTADFHIRNIQRYQRPFGCVLNYHLNVMDYFHRAIFWIMHTHSKEDHDSFFRRTNDYIFHNVSKKIRKGIPAMLPKVLRNIIKDYIPKHLIEIYPLLSNEDKQNFITWYNQNLIKNENNFIYVFKYK